MKSADKTIEKKPSTAAVTPTTVTKAPSSSAPSNVTKTATASNRATIDVDSFLDRLMCIGRPKTGISTSITEQDIMDLLVVSRNLFMEQPAFLELATPISIVGDIHGQFTDLMRIFQKTGFPNKTNYLFLGDYVDRGPMNLETILILLAYKIKYPLNFFLLRGNHETQFVNRVYGFYEEINRRYQSPRVYDMFQDVFNWMPLSACVGERILCMHGGLSPDIAKANSLKVLNTIKRPLPNPPNPSLALDLLWADPDISTEEFKVSNRGVSVIFGPKIVKFICKKHKLDLVVRAHQVVQDGYEFFAQRKLVTLFSAPHYCGEFDNAAAVLVVSRDLQCSFRILRPKFPKASPQIKIPIPIVPAGRDG